MFVNMTRAELVLWALLSAWVYWTFFGSHAHAQCPHEPDHVLLGRTFVSERGWRTETDDAQAIWEVVLVRMEAHDETVREAVCALSERLHGGTVSRSWLQHLRADGSRPAGLRATWETPRRTRDGTVLPSRREAWLATLAQAAALIADGALAPRICERPPVTWGSHADVAWRRRTGHTFTEIDCGRTVNLFGVVGPRRSR